MKFENDGYRIEELEKWIEFLESRIENLLGCLYQIENIDREDEELASWWARDALMDDTAAVKEWENER